MPTAPNIGDLHEDQITELLRSGAHAALLITYFGETQYRELSELARLAATRSRARRHVVFILPGVMGSRLADVRQHVAHLLWLHPHALHEGALMQLALPGARTIKPVGVMLPGYLKMKLWLEADGFRAMFHPFDWRRDLEHSAHELVRAIDACNVGSVSIVAHSMGGLVARAALNIDGSTRLKRIVQLGSPNQGSYAPLQALRAVYPTVRKIACLDPTHSAEQIARTAFHTFDGVYQMLPSDGEDGPIDLFDLGQWPTDELAPDPELLARARSVRARLAPGDERCSAIVGVNQPTITHASVGAGGFEYEIRVDGDATVPLARAQWRGAQHRYVVENHGALTQNRLVLAAVADLLKRGETTHLDANPQPGPNEALRRTRDSELRAQPLRKVNWESLSPDSRRRILEPVITPEFRAPEL